MTVERYLRDSGSPGMMSSLPLLLLVVQAFLSFPAPAWSSDADIAAMTAVRGPVSVKRPGAGTVSNPATGTALRTGDEIRTGDAGMCQFTLVDETFVNLGPRSAARVNQLSFDEATDRRTAVIQVLEGSARIVVYRLRSNDSLLRVEAEPASVLLNSIADIAVTMSPSGTETVVLKGRARVRNRLSYIVGEVRLTENQRTIVAVKKPPTAPMVVGLQEHRDLLRNWKGL